MRDPDGNPLPGIEGMPGVRDEKTDGSFIGCDFIRMQPGSYFPLHSHAGDHELYVIQGRGFVYIDGKNFPIRGGTLVHIPAEYPHGVHSHPDGRGTPLIFVAMGHPHKRVDAIGRMKIEYPPWQRAAMR